jgi:predicted lipoprotein
MMKKIPFILLLAVIFTMSCKKETTSKYDDVIQNITDNIIVATYSDLDNNAGDLVSTTTLLKNDPSNAAKLTSAKAAWVAARVAWEASEGFLFGPVSDLDIDPNIDTWPLDSAGISTILSGTESINKEYIDKLTGDAGTGLKGFHAIEYILWGMDGNRTAGSFSARELAYLVACAESLKDQTAQLKDAWVGSGNYANTVKKHNNGIFNSESAVLVELAEGIRGISGEVWNSKIKNTIDGYYSDGAEGGIREEESRF